MRDSIVSPSWLADHLEAVRVVDVRDAWEFDGIGHVPGAVNIPFDAFRATTHAAERDDGADAEPGGDDTTGMLPGVDVWEELLSEAGISSDDSLIVYDDTHGVFAARFLVTALAYGHDDVRLLDGDFSAWNREHEVEREAVAYPTTDYEARPPAETPFVDFETVRGMLDDEDVVVLDTRERWEWEEGHLPGAVQLDWTELVDEDSRGLKPVDELEAVLEARGVTPDSRVLLYCNTARRISHTFVALRQLGYGDVSFYEGSLIEWEARGAPVETG